MLRNEVLNLKFSQIIENFPGIPGKQLYFPGLENTPGSRERNPSEILIKLSNLDRLPACETSFNTFAVHDVYRRHPHLVQVMPPSIQVLLLNAKKQ